jgi:hypothetical protein
MPQKKRRVVSRGGKPRMVNVRMTRSTLPNHLGQSFPCLFGIGATALLIFVAANPGKTMAQAVRALGRSSRGPFILVRDRLVRHGLLVVGERDWDAYGGRPLYLNPMLEHFEEFVDLLRSLARMHGVRTSRQHQLEVSSTSRSPLPKNLFWTNLRTDVLLLVAALGETYMAELFIAVKRNTQQVGARLDELVAEGLLRNGVVSGVNLHSLDPRFGAARPLKRFLDAMLTTRPAIQIAAKAIALKRDRTLQGVGTARRSAIASIAAKGRAQ